MSFSYLLSNIERIDKPFIEKASDFFLEPLHFLFQGKAIYLLKPENFIVGEKPLYKEHSYLQIVLAICALLPATLIGVAFRALSFGYTETRHAFSLASEFVQNHFSPQVNSGQNIRVAHAITRFKIDKLLEKMTSREIWRNQEFLLEVDQVMQEAFNKAENLFHHLQGEAQGDPQQMANQLIIQFREDGPVYCFDYFYDSITSLYHMARGNWYTHGDPCYFTIPNLSEVDEAVFFQEGTLQERWRSLYNQFCEKLDQLNMREHLSDGRFSNWAQPDRTYPLGRFGEPDTKPTPNFSYFHLYGNGESFTDSLKNYVENFSSQASHLLHIIC